MRIRLLALGIAALAVTGCSSTDPQQIAPSTSTTTTTTTSTPTRAVDPAVEDTKDRAFAYFVSQERRARFDSFFANEGVRYVRQMMQGEIPSKTRGWFKPVSPTPVDAYGLIESDNRGDTNKPFLSVVVYFDKQGRIDLSRPVQSVYIIKGNRSVDVDGSLVVKSDGSTMSDSPEAYCWRMDDAKPGTELGFTIGKRDGGSPNPDKPLDPKQKYTVQARANFAKVISEADVRMDDLTLFEKLAGELKLNPSDWR